MCSCPIGGMMLKLPSNECLAFGSINDYCRPTMPVQFRYRME